MTGPPDDSAAPRPPRVVHLIPFDGIGGVEVAARSMGSQTHGRFCFSIDYIFRRPSTRGKAWRLFNPAPFLCAIARHARNPPEVLVVSLWRSAIVGTMVKLLRPRTKLVLFIHNATDVHFADYLFTRAALSLASQVWSDSLASQQQRLPQVDGRSARVISFVTRRISAGPSRHVRPGFIFWGRITAQKALHRALAIFAAISQEIPGASLTIIGPDGGSLASLQQDIEVRNLGSRVRLLAEADFPTIQQEAEGASFYLQTSLFEGMAMAVVEAMQLGLVPVVTPVGAIPSYCRHRENAVLVADDRQVVEDVLALLACNEEYQRTRAAAIRTWEEVPLYEETVVSACEEILAARRTPTPTLIRRKEERK